MRKSKIAGTKKQNGNIKDIGVIDLLINET